jgi:hypothetical protein
MPVPRFDDQTLARIADWLRDENVDPSYVRFVELHVDQPDSAWRWCCGSNCDPCVVRLGCVIDRARQLPRSGNPPNA